MNSSLIKHFPVMARNVLTQMKQFPSIMPLKVADCNFGLGGHSRLVLRNFPQAQMYDRLYQRQAFDLDPLVVEYYKDNYAKQLSEEEAKRLTITQANFSSISETKIFGHFNVILADFGFCSYHLETDRGFSWLKDEELDMRYSPTGRTCAEIINQSSQLEIMSILSRYGGLKGAKQISEAVVQARPIRTTQQLKSSILKCFQEDKTRKVAQVFQAFRIATNNELKDIQKLCQSLEKCLKKDGLFIAVTFHSLERDIIYNFLRSNRKMFSKAEMSIPSLEEQQVNSKSKSAKMICFKKVQ